MDKLAADLKSDVKKQ